MGLPHEDAEAMPVRDRIEVSLLVGLLTALGMAAIWAGWELVTHGLVVLTVVFFGFIAAILTFIIDTVTSRP
jgi:hypothetical protein